MQIMSDFIKARIETTRRGFFVRADYEGAFEKSARDPSTEGLYLQVDVAEGFKKVTDETKRENELFRRFVEIPSGRKGVQDIQIELSYGQDTPRQSLKAISTCIQRIKRIAGDGSSHRQIHSKASRRSRSTQTHSSKNPDRPATK